jgi:hypothetical protein
LIERVYIAGAALKKEVARARIEVNRTRETIVQVVSQARERMLQEMQDNKDRIIGAGMQFVELSKEEQTRWTWNAFEIMQEFFKTLKAGPSNLIVALFAMFQLTVILSCLHLYRYVGFYKEEERKTFLTPVAG